MKVCIVGENSLVSDLTEALLPEGHEVFLCGSGDDFDFDPYSHRKLYTYTWNFDPDFTLRENSWPEIDAAVVLTENDEKNLLAGRILKEKGVKKVLVLVNDYDTYRIVSESPERFYVDEVFNESFAMATTVNKFIEEDDVIPGESFWNRRLEICRHTVYYDEGLMNTALRDTDKLDGLVAVSIYRQKKFFVPRGDTVLENGDKLYLMGKHEDILEFKRKFTDREEVRDTKKLWILGSGRRGEELAKALIGKGYEVKYTVEDPEEKRRLRDSLPEAYVESAPHTSLRTYEEEDGEYHGVICSSDDDDKNVVMALLAQYAGAGKAISVLDRADYAPMTEGLPIALQLRPRLGLLNQLLRSIRTDVKMSIHQVLGGNTEVLEMALQDNSPVLGSDLRDLKLPRGVIIGGILRRTGEVIIPDGSTVLKPGDRLVIFASAESGKGLLKLLHREEPMGILTELLHLY